MARQPCASRPATTATSFSKGSWTRGHTCFLEARFVFAQRAFCAADILARAAMDIVFFAGADSAFFGRPGPRLIFASVSKAFACWSFNISASICAMIWLVSIDTVYFRQVDGHYRRRDSLAGSRLNWLPVHASPSASSGGWNHSAVKRLANIDPFAGAGHARKAGY